MGNITADVPRNGCRTHPPYHWRGGVDNNCSIIQEEEGLCNVKPIKYDNYYGCLVYIPGLCTRVCSFATYSSISSAI